jgi:glycine hydroxymethyltransferase
MSTYKSLGGPPGGLLVTNRADLAERLDAIAYPGLTANFDVSKTAALAHTLLDWVDHGEAYTAAMIATATSLAGHLLELGLPVHTAGGVFTASHQFAVDAEQWGGGHEASLRLRDANLLACAIGLPNKSEWSGLRIGTPEIVKLGMTTRDMAELAQLIHDGLVSDPKAVAVRVSALRRRFPTT